MARETSSPATAQAGVRSVATPLVKAVNVTRKFGGVTAVSEVDLEVFPGELVGIMGPNGAGKSTLLSLLSGTRRPSSGQLEVCGRDFSQITHSDAAHIGVGLAHQIPKPFRKLTVRQNVEIASYVVPRARRKDVIHNALEVTGLLGRADKIAGSLGLLELKRLEVARVLALDPELVLLDEVAAGLNGSDLDELIELVRKVHAGGKTVILVEHVQEVIHQLAQRVVVLEWGQKLLEGTPAEVSADQRVIDIYLGDTENSQSPTRSKAVEPNEPRLKVSNLGAAYGPVNVLKNVNLEVRPGEILAVLGSNGAGKSTLAKTLEGMVKAKSGSILFKGADVTNAPVFKRMRSGMALVPEGRRLFGELSVKENLHLGLKNPRHAEPLDKVFELFPKLVELSDRRAGALSGGEQQMVAIGRAIAGEPEIIIFDELSLGLAPIIVDRMLDAVAQIADWGTSVILIEQSVHKSLSLADKILVLRRGEVVFSGAPSDFTEEELQNAYLGAS
ncbi:ATP-binding cassette domain-containing protein [Aurantimicrobium minutum]|uniref:ATP-binding cassette domain-containing protein n=1 Tax=Aurantimicrobium minutum TaxID=708131 RepID=UPI0024744B01|nr:ATP-binding cassette domain-containing protein [Aurantimicrobium minutum]MDH6207108.1 branched-chain amino acid transport system ATP-binding protein [Aurantimicrobium minutum]